MITKRESSLDLLRIILSVGVIVLHVNNYFLGIATPIPKMSTISKIVICFFEGLCIISVNEFIILSGYFNATRESIKIKKIVTLIFQTIFINEVLYLISMLQMGGGIDLKKIILKLIPANYYLVLYSTIYIICPLINRCLKHTPLDKLKNIGALLFCLFSVLPSLIDLANKIFNTTFFNEMSTVGRYGSEWGYTVVNFALCYFIGAIIRLYAERLKKIKIAILFITLTVCLIIETLSIYFEKNITNSSNGLAFIAIEYCSPIIIIEAIIVFLLFQRMMCKPNKAFGFLAKYTFLVFLIHPYFVDLIPLGVVKDNVLLIGTSVLMIAVLSFALSIVLDKVFKCIFKKPIDKISNRIQWIFEI